MNKKIISLVLALVMVLGTFTSVFAAETTKKAEVKKEETKAEKVEKVVGKDNKIQYIIDKKFVEGYEDGSYGYDKNIKRSEVTKLLVYANGNKELAERLQGTMQLYSDVNTENWANGVINVGSTVKSDANGLVMLEGYPNGTFKPENNVTYAELAKMLVVLAKEDLTADMAKNAKWSADWMTWAAQLGILDDVTVANSDAAATRADAFTMIYNALYAMKEFKAVPANEVRGILSSLDNNKLVLNQNSDKEYKITENTVFVSGENTRKQVVNVTTMNNKDFYLGSLVRVLINDKNEVTHILELGNPKDMAIGLEDGVYGDNNLWEGVADKTVSTEYDKRAETLKDNDKSMPLFNSYVTVKTENADVKSLTFHNVKADKKDAKSENLTVKVNDKTEVYVANPYNNIMREVKDIHEAMSLIGYRDFNAGFRIPNVYAGYDTSDVDYKYATNDVKSKTTAKVVVFNVVSKEESDLYRVIQTTRSNYVSVVENTDGDKFEKDTERFENIFPFNAYKGLYDVVEVFGYGNNAKIETKIDHSETDDYPIVEVIKADDDYIVVRDEDEKYELTLDIRDADIFTAKDKLEKGSVVQFRLEDNKKDTRVVDILSILPKDTKLDGSLYDFDKASQENQKVGKILSVDVKANEVEMRYWEKVEGESYKYTDRFHVTEETAKALESIGTNTELAFKVSDRYHDGLRDAYDFRYNDTLKPIEKVEETTGNIDAIKAAIKSIEAKYPDQASVDNDYENAKKATEAARKMINDLKFEEKQEWDNNVKAIYEPALTKVEGFVTNKTAALKTEADADITAVNAKVVTATADVKVAKDTIANDTALAKVKEVVEPVLEKGVTAKYEVTALDTTANTATVKVTLEKAPGTAQEVNVAVTEEV